MSVINSTESVYSSAGLRTEPDQVEDTNEDQKADFLLLMTEQIKHQDPLNPLEGQDFLAQLAQFSMVDELAQLNNSFAELSESVVSDQSLQAASLIGKQALVDSDNAYLGLDEPLEGAVEMPAGGGELLINFYDDIGQPVRQLSLGTQAGGPVNFSWDGMRDDGEWAGTGSYRIEALANTAEGNESLPVQVQAGVESISIGNSGGLVLNLAGIGALPYSAVNAIR